MAAAEEEEAQVVEAVEVPIALAVSGIGIAQMEGLEGVARPQLFLHLLARHQVTVVAALELTDRITRQRVPQGEMVGQHCPPLVAVGHQAAGREAMQRFLGTGKRAEVVAEEGRAAVVVAEGAAVMALEVRAVEEAVQA